MSALFSACRGNRLSSVQNLVLGGANINFRHGSGSTPLTASMECNQFHIASYLVSLPGIEVDHRDCFDNTALHYVCKKGVSTDLAGRILEKSSDKTINSEDRYGNTPLVCAVRYNNSHMVEMLARMDNIVWDQEQLVRAARYHQGRVTILSISLYSL